MGAVGCVGDVAVVTTVDEPVAWDTDAVAIIADGMVAAIKPLLVILLFIRLTTVGVLELTTGCVAGDDDDVATGVTGCCKAVADPFEPDDMVDWSTAPAWLMTTVSLFVNDPCVTAATGLLLGCPPTPVVLLVMLLIMFCCCCSCS